MDITKLQTHLPAGIYSQIPGILPFGIDGPKRLSHLLGQCHTETGGYKVFVENLNYSAQGLANTWPTRYAVDPKATPKVPNALAVKLARNPTAIANNVYADRIGNGNETSEDGSRYIGRGCIQLTGRSNYKAFGDSIGIDLLLHPELVATDYQMASAAFFFKTHNLWTICDKGIDTDTITKVSKVVNGGEHGLPERIKWTEFYYKVLTS